MLMLSATNQTDLVKHINHEVVFEFKTTDDYMSIYIAGIYCRSSISFDPSNYDKLTIDSYLTGHTAIDYVRVEINDKKFEVKSNNTTELLEFSDKIKNVLFVYYPKCGNVSDNDMYTMRDLKM